MESKSNAFQVQVPLLQASKSVMKILSQLVERVQGRCQSIHFLKKFTAQLFQITVSVSFKGKSSESADKYRTTQALPLAIFVG